MAWASTAMVCVSIAGIGTPEPWEKHVQSCLGSGRNQHQYPEDIRALQNQRGYEGILYVQDLGFRRWVAV